MKSGHRVSLLGGLLAAGLLAVTPGLRAEEPPAPTTSQEASESMGIQNNMAVQLEYTLKVDGQVVDSTDGRGPFQYIHGQSQIIPGLEKQLTGLHAGDSKEVTVAPDEGYGPVDPAAFVEVPKTQLPPDLAPEVGLMLRGVDPEGRSFRAKISEVKDQTVTLDLNHPLAGKTLLFQIKVISVSPPAPAAS